MFSLWSKWQGFLVKVQFLLRLKCPSSMTFERSHPRMHARDSGGWIAFLKWTVSESEQNKDSLIALGNLNGSRY